MSSPPRSNAHLETKRFSKSRRDPSPSHPCVGVIYRLPAELAARLSYCHLRVNRGPSACAVEHGQHRPTVEVGGDNKSLVFESHGTNRGASKQPWAGLGKVPRTIWETAGQCHSTMGKLSPIPTTGPGRRRCAVSGTGGCWRRSSGPWQPRVERGLYGSRKVFHQLKREAGVVAHHYLDAPVTRAVGDALHVT